LLVTQSVFEHAVFADHIIFERCGRSDLRAISE
jgi:hypothetical protein